MKRNCNFLLLVLVFFYYVLPDIMGFILIFILIASILININPDSIAKIKSKNRLQDDIIVCQKDLDNQRNIINHLKLQLYETKKALDRQRSLANILRERMQLKIERMEIKVDKLHQLLSKEKLLNKKLIAKLRQIISKE